MSGIDTSALAIAVIGRRRLELLDRVRIYACGITPYDVTHLGHAATIVWVDVLVRVLQFLTIFNSGGYRVWSAGSRCGMPEV